MGNRGIQPLLFALRAKRKILPYYELVTISAERSENLQERLYFNDFKASYLHREKYNENSVEI